MSLIEWVPAAPCCGTDKTWKSQVLRQFRRGRPRKARMILHYSGDARFWHWSDVKDLEWPTY